HGNRNAEVTTFRTGVARNLAMKQTRSSIVRFHSCGQSPRRAAAPLLLVTLCLFAPRSVYSEPVAADAFGAEVTSLLKSHCVKCHGPIEPKGDLDLSSFAALARGAAGEPVVLANKPDESALWIRVAAGEMPP